MKPSLSSHHALLLLIVFFLLSSYFTSATRFLNPLQGEKKDVLDGLTQRSSSLKEVEQEDTFDLIGEEHCENGDEECFKRRMVAEAHLDYIYTQGLHHKP